MLDDLIAAYGNRFLVAALGVSLALLCLFIVLWILRNRAPSPFVRGGRNRQPRLQVLDAAAVDTRRRIVLIRRDNVEHLVMIGGPTDIVIESGIGEERAYLSARPVTQMAEEEQAVLATPAHPQAKLAAAEPPTPIIGAPVAIAEAAPVEPPARRAPVAETSKIEPSTAPPRPISVATERTDQKPAPAMAPIRTPEPAAERPVAAAVLPIIAAPAAVMPAAAAPISKPVIEQAPTVQTEAPTIAPIPRSEQPAEKPMAVEEPAVQPTAHLEPVLSVEADVTPTQGNFEVIRREPQTIQTAPLIEPQLTAGTEPVEPVMTKEVQPAHRDDDRVVLQAEPPLVLPPVIDPPAAEEFLESARQRVLAPAAVSAPAVIVQPHRGETAANIASSTVTSETPQRDMSDFERVLEEEMALHLAADPAPAAQPASTIAPILPETRADRPRPPVSAVLPEGNRPVAGQTTAQPGEEPNLQNEIARIFGEMSASRNP
jgi:hypothetical protein